MSQEKQIEEMAEAIFQNCNCGLFYSEAERISDFVINKQGYRKASEVAREIFEEIEKMLINEHIESFKALDDTWTHRFKESLFIELNKLKKKYTEGKR